MRSPLLILVLATICLDASGQENVKDSCYLPLNVMIKEQIVPVVLLTGSLILNAGNIKERIQDVFPNTNTRLDDYLKYAPIVQIYSLDLMGFRHKNDIFTQTKYLAFSEASSGVLVEVIKKVTNIKRPTGAHSSYPSGHTCFAFAGATVLYREFRDDSPVLAYSGYIAAAATGILRITNDAHWLPDVLAGAGLGILMTNLIYYIEPLKDWPHFSKVKNISIEPGINDQGLSVLISF